MNVAVLDTAEFEAAWDASEQHRYGYALNRRVAVTLLALILLCWSVLVIVIVGQGFAWPYAVVGFGFAVLTVYAGMVLLKWRGFTRLSGVICSEDRLMWRDPDGCFSVGWRELDFDTIGLLDMDMTSNQYEHYLRLGDRRLYLFRPFVSLRRLEQLMGEVLIRLQAHDRGPKRASRKRRR